MQVVVEVRLVDVVLFSVSSLVGGLSAGTLGGTLLTFLAAFVGQAYLRQGVDSALLVAGVYLAIVATIGLLLSGLIIAMAVARRHENQILGQVWYTISESGIELKSEERRESLTWSQITNTRKNDRYIWVETDDYRTRFVPKSGCDSHETFARIWNQVEKFTGPAD